MSEVSVPSLTDCSKEEFEKWVNSQNIGMVMSAQNLLIACFEQLSEVRKATVNKIKEDDAKGEDTAKLFTYLNDMVYPMLYRIENRVFFCKDRIYALQKEAKESEN